MRCFMAPRASRVLLTWHNHRPTSTLCHSAHGNPAQAWLRCADRPQGARGVSITTGLRGTHLAAHGPAAPPPAHASAVHRRQAGAGTRAGLAGPRSQMWAWRTRWRPRASRTWRPSVRAPVISLKSLVMSHWSHVSGVTQRGGTSHPQGLAGPCVRARVWRAGIRAKGARLAGSCVLARAYVACADLVSLNMLQPVPSCAVNVLTEASSGARGDPSGRYVLALERTWLLTRADCAGTFAYAAPELLTGFKCNEKADIWCGAPRRQALA